MKRRRIALLVTASVATPVLLGGASAVADTMTAEAHPVHATKAATSDDRLHASGGGLVLRLDGVPAEFEAGGEWQEFDLVLENVSEKDVSDFAVEIELVTLIPDAPLRPADVSVQVRSNGAWVDAPLWDLGGERDVAVIVPVDGMVLPPGIVGMPVRMKFTKDAPLVQFHLGPRPDDDHAESEEEFWESAWITRPADPEPEPSVEPEPSEDPGPEPSVDPEPEPSEDPGPDPSEEPDPEPEPSEDPEPSMEPGPEPSTDPEPEPSEDPEPEPSTDPSSSPGPGPSEKPDPGPGAGGGAATGGGTGGGGTGPAPGGASGVPGGGTGASSGGAAQGGWTAPATGGAPASGSGLAHTGSDAVTSWALGAGGTLVLLGTALAVAGRRVRRRSSGM
ncbi:hypothetical protein [Streptomyces parvus]|uniref:hypothetical protein n=1 Tax=Streptomyces parvus TaxID=66428 RepID=UPI0033CDCA00